MSEETVGLTDATPRRRHDDCPNFDRHHIDKLKYIAGRPASKMILDYLVVSASLSVLVLVFHVYQALKRLDEHTSLILPVMVEQNKIMNEIHNSIHAEGEISRASKGAHPNAKPHAR